MLRTIILLLISTGVNAQWCCTDKAEDCAEVVSIIPVCFKEVCEPCVTAYEVTYDDLTVELIDGSGAAFDSTGLTVNDCNDCIIDPCIEVPDLVISSDSDVSDLNAGWNTGYYTSDCPLTGDFEFCYTYDFTDASHLAIINLGAQGSFWGDFAIYNYNWESGANDRDWKRVRHENAYTTGWIQLQPIAECEVCITRTGSAVTYSFDGNLVYTDLTAGTQDVYVNYTLYGHPNNIWSTGTHNITNVSACSVTTGMRLTNEPILRRTLETINLTADELKAAQIK